MFILQCFGRNYGKSGNSYVKDGIHLCKKNLAGNGIFQHCVLTRVNIIKKIRIWNSLPYFDKIIENSNIAQIYTV